MAHVGMNHPRPPPPSPRNSSTELFGSSFPELTPDKKQSLALVQIFVLQHWRLIRRARDGSNSRRDGDDDDGGGDDDDV